MKTGTRIPGVPPLLFSLSCLLSRLCKHAPALLVSSPFPPTPPFQLPSLSLFFLLIFLPTETQNPCNPHDPGLSREKGKRHEQRLSLWTGRESMRRKWMLGTCRGTESTAEEGGKDNSKKYPSYFGGFLLVFQFRKAAKLLNYFIKQGRRTFVAHISEYDEVSDDRVKIWDSTAAFRRIKKVRFRFPSYTVISTMICQSKPSFKYLRPYATCNALFIFNRGPAQRGTNADELWFVRCRPVTRTKAHLPLCKLWFTSDEPESLWTPSRWWDGEWSPPTLLCNLFQRESGQVFGSRQKPITA